jgi:hypothetical protein
MRILQKSLSESFCQGAKSSTLELLDGLVAIDESNHHDCPSNSQTRHFAREYKQQQLTSPLVDKLTRLWAKMDLV